MRGYDKSFPLELNSESNAMFGGAHRLGICLYLNIENVPCVFLSNEKLTPKKYDIEYFEKILKPNEILTMKNKLKEYNDI